MADCFNIVRLLLVISRARNRGASAGRSATRRRPDRAFAPPTTAIRTSRADRGRAGPPRARRSEDHTSELQSLMRISYDVFCMQKVTTITTHCYILHFLLIMTTPQ